MQYGRYKVLSQLGKGGMATVYLAEDPALSRLVAIKVIQTQLLQNDTLLQRFTKEARVVATLRHANIVEIFDFGTENGQHYIVMEYMDGPTLGDICSSMGKEKLPLTITAAFLCQVAEGLDSAAKRGIVHRDIKPENLMINADGVIKIADFGIAHLSEEQSHTATGEVLGSPHFMSPEQVEGQKPSSKTDLWALGCILYYCIKGEFPFRGPTLASTLRQICDQEPEPLALTHPHLPEEIGDLIITLLNKNVEFRGPDASLVARILRQYLGTQGITNISETCKNFLSNLEVKQSSTLADFSPKSPTGNTSAIGRGVPLYSPTGSQIPHRINTGVRGNTTVSGSEQISFTQEQTQYLNSQAKKTKTVFLISAILFLLTLGLIGGIAYKLFSGKASESNAVVQNPIKEILFEEKTLTLDSGGAKLLEFSVYPPQANKELIWSSTDTSVALVKRGFIRAQKPGKALIVATSVENKNVDAVCMLTVNSVTQPEPAPITENKEVRKEPIKKADPIPNSKKPPQATSQPSINSAPLQASTLKLFSAPPFASITVNGIDWGQTPMSKSREIPPGNVHIRFFHKQFSARDTVVFIGPGKNEEIRLNFFAP